MLRKIYLRLYITTRVISSEGNVNLNMLNHAKTDTKIPHKTLFEDKFCPCYDVNTTGQRVTNGI